jgi:hypothetical protein
MPLRRADHSSKEVLEDGAGHVEYTGEIRNAYIILVGKYEGKFDPRQRQRIFV